MAWLVRAGEPEPHPLVMNAIWEELREGNGLLLIAGDRATRDRAREIIASKLPPGFLALPLPAKRGLLH